MNALAARALLPLLAVIAIHVPLVPFGQGADRAYLPDLLFCLLLAWTVRRPAAVPVVLVVLLGLLADLMLGRPPGLGTLGLLLATEAVRARRRLPFLLEWPFAAFLFAGALALHVLLLGITFAATPDAGSLLAHLVTTALAYPAIALIVQLALGRRQETTA